MDLELWKKQKKALHLTYEELAKRAKLPKGSIQNIFAGYVPTPRIDTVEAIEEALELRNKHEWTDEEKAAGIGRRAIYLSDDEFDWLELRSEVLRTKGEDYLNTLIVMINAAITENLNKKP